MTRSLKRAIAIVGLFLLLLGVPVMANAQSACDAPEHAQFDFWVGHWQVFKKDGTLAGTSHVEKTQGGCVVHERYTTPAGYDGQSLNMYDAGRGGWHQSWVDNSGMLLLLDGGLVDGKMVMEGATTGQDGVVTRHRITWTPNPDGTVRQFWESTNPAGEWTVAFNGLYHRTEAP